MLSFRYSSVQPGCPVLLGDFSHHAVVQFMGSVLEELGEAAKTGGFGESKNVLPLSYNDSLNNGRSLLKNQKLSFDVFARHAKRHLGLTSETCSAVFHAYLQTHPSNSSEDDSSEGSKYVRSPERPNKKQRVVKYFTDCGSMFLYIIGYAIKFQLQAESVLRRSMSATSWTKAVLPYIPWLVACCMDIPKLDVKGLKGICKGEQRSIKQLRSHVLCRSEINRLSVLLVAFLPDNDLWPSRKGKSKMWVPCSIAELAATYQNMALRGECSDITVQFEGYESGLPKELSKIMMDKHQVQAGVLIDLIDLLLRNSEQASSDACSWCNKHGAGFGIKQVLCSDEKDRRQDVYVNTDFLKIGGQLHGEGKVVENVEFDTHKRNLVIKGSACVRGKYAQQILKSGSGSDGPSIHVHASYDLVYDEKDTCVSMETEGSRSQRLKYAVPGNSGAVSAIPLVSIRLEGFRNSHILITRRDASSDDLTSVHLSFDPDASQESSGGCNDATHMLHVSVPPFPARVALEFADLVACVVRSQALTINTSFIGCEHSLLNAGVISGAMSTVGCRMVTLAGVAERVQFGMCCNVSSLPSESKRASGRGANSLLRARGEDSNTTFSQAYVYSLLRPCISVVPYGSSDSSSCGIQKLDSVQDFLFSNRKARPGAVHGFADGIRLGPFYCPYNGLAAHLLRAKYIKRLSAGDSLQTQFQWTSPCDAWSRPIVTMSPYMKLNDLALKQFSSTKTLVSCCMAPAAKWRELVFSGEEATQMDAPDKSYFVLDPSDFSPGCFIAVENTLPEDSKSLPRLSSEYMKQMKQSQQRAMQLRQMLLRKSTVLNDTECSALQQRVAEQFKKWVSSNNNPARQYFANMVNQESPSVDDLIKKMVVQIAGIKISPENNENEPSYAQRKVRSTGASARSASHSSKDNSNILRSHGN